MSASRDDGRGRDATSPAGIPRRGWKDILLRVKDEVGADHLGLVAAGTTFYVLLALFPAIAAVVAIYGLVADPDTIAQQVRALEGVLPEGGVAIVEEQLRRVSEAGGGSLGLAFVGGLLLSLWSASKGVKALIEALNIVYEEEEKRGFVKLTLLTMALTLMALLMAALTLTGVVVVPAVLSYLGLGELGRRLVSLLRWPVLLLGVALVLAVLYRYGPSRRRPRWRWVTWGSGLAALAWLVLSLAYSWFIANFGSYNETYGSLGAVIGFMMWMWLSLFVALGGAELDAEIEHQTARDTTAGPERPRGRRGAAMADTLGETRGES